MRTNRAERVAVALSAALPIRPHTYVRAVVCAGVTRPVCPATWDDGVCEEKGMTAVWESVCGRTVLLRHGLVYWA
jgi:hypothetical protein